jgi:quercetin dioxygenase-like cupin family protein
MWLGSLVLIVACQGSRPAAEDYPDAVTADPAHYAVEFENDAVRLLRIRYGPGETSVMHHHPTACSVALSSASWRMTDPEGNVTEEDPANMGDVTCGIEPNVHSPENSGSAASELILAEFTEGASAGAWSSSVPDALSADPSHYTLEWENEAVRVLRVSYAGGEQSVMHHHPAYCFVPLNDGLWHMADANGDVTDVRTAAGQVVCGDAEVHRPVNATDEAGGAILFEFKGREVAAP